MFLELLRPRGGRGSRAQGDGRAMAYFLVFFLAVLALPLAGFFGVAPVAARFFLKIAS